MVPTPPPQAPHEARPLASIGFFCAFAISLRALRETVFSRKGAEGSQRRKERLLNSSVHYTFIQTITHCEALKDLGARGYRDYISAGPTGCSPATFRSARPCLVHDCDGVRC